MLCFDDNSSNSGNGRDNNNSGGRGNNGNSGRGNNGGGRGDNGGGRGSNGSNNNNGGYNNTGNHNYNDYNNNNYAPQDMNSQDFNAARGTIQRTTFENTRLQVAKQIVGVNYLNTIQITDICRLFTFEDSRLDFAKFAYNHCTDPQNYYRIGEVFTFNSNTAALSDFVTSNPRVNNNYNNTPQYAPNEGNNYNNNQNNYNDNQSNNQNNYNNNNQNSNSTASNSGVSDADFQSIRTNIKNKTVESTKLQVAKQICETRYFTAEQIAQLARLFLVESYKFEFAKAAYASCINPLNYYKVNDVFTVQSYVRDLTEYVRGR